MKSPQFSEYLTFLETLNHRSSRGLASESANYIQAVFPGSKIIIFTVHSSKEVAECIAVDKKFCAATNIQLGITLALKDKGLMSTVCVKGRSVIYHNIAKNRYLTTREQELFCWSNNTLTDMMASPLMHRGHIRGALCLIKPVGLETFLASDLNDCRTYAIITAAYLCNIDRDMSIDTVPTETVDRLALRQYSLLTCKHLKPIPRYVESQQPLHIIGERGVGKCHMALLLHAMSNQRESDCLIINCDTFRGDITGLFAQLSSGTLIFRNINALARELQIALIEIVRNNTKRIRCVTLQNQQDYDWRTPDNQTPFSQLVNPLNSSVIYIAPLRNRIQETLMLADFFIKRYSIEHTYTEYTISEQARQEIAEYYWPENCHELKQVLYNNVQKIDDQRLQIDHLHILQKSNTLSLMNLRTATHNFRARYINYTLAICRGNQTKAARHLNIQRSYLNRIIHKGR